MKRIAILLILCLSAFAATARTLTPSDFAQLRDVGSPHLSPDGNWVVYTVRQADLADDKNRTHLWLASWDGKENVQLTFSDESESSPRWSPDGRRIAFLSSRGGKDDDDSGTQLWIMNRIGGEGEKVTSVEGSVADFDWSPDGRRVVLAVEDPDPKPAKDAKDAKAPKTKPPVVIDRYHFKEDRTGYLTTKRQHLYLFDLESRKLEPLTSGIYNEHLPQFSPDGSRISFVSKRGDDIDRVDYDLFVIDAKPGATPKKISTYKGDNHNPEWGRVSWSPDGKWIATIRGGDPKLIYYAVRSLALVPVDGGEAKLLTKSLDRNIGSPNFSDDGKWLYLTIEDDRNESLVRIPATGGAPVTIAGGKRVIGDYDMAHGHLVIQASDPKHPNELFAVDGAAERRLTHQNDAFLSGIELGTVEELDSVSKDGTHVHGFVTTPPNFTAGTKYPAILRIHGGPVSQFANQFSFEWQLLAANGYVVVATNPRGSSGRGEAYSKAIWADWGTLDTQDVLSAVDTIIKRGLADPERLGVGGWSYGGILTNYVIVNDHRFKAATSGASIANILAGYGTDQYTSEYEYELGTPWKNTETYLKISTPFLHADRITTPTLFLAGDKDFNVPLLNSEQMYQALRSQNVPTQLVIYPGQYHGISKPSYVKDRYERYLAWYAKYLTQRTASRE